VLYGYVKIESDMIVWSAGPTAPPASRCGYIWGYVISPTFGAVGTPLGGGRMWCTGWTEKNCGPG